MPRDLTREPMERAVHMIEAMAEEGLSWDQTMRIIKRFNEKQRPERERKRRARGRYVRV